MTATEPNGAAVWLVEVTAAEAAQRALQLALELEV